MAWALALGDGDGPEDLDRVDRRALALYPRREEGAHEGGGGAVEDRKPRDHPPRSARYGCRSPQGAAIEMFDGRDLAAVMATSLVHSRLCGTAS